MKLLFVFFLACCFLGCQTLPPVVSEIISGDTIVLSDGRKIRYAAIESPQKDSSWFDFCRDANVYLVQDKSVQLIMESSQTTPDAIFAYVYTPIQIGEETKYLFVNAELVRFGFAKVLPVPNDTAQKRLWESLWQLQESEAKPNQKGIWGEK